MGSHMSKKSPNGGPRYSVVVTQDKKSLGKGYLEVFHEDISLQLSHGDQKQMTWPIRSIRRYGCDGDLFNFESGRRCSTGPGLFTFKSKHAQKIFLHLQANVDSIQKGDQAARLGRCSPSLSKDSHQPEMVPHYQDVSPKAIPVNFATIPVNLERPQYVNCDVNGKPLGDLENQGIHYAEIDVRKFDEAGGNEGRFTGFSRNGKSGTLTRFSPVSFGVPKESTQYTTIDAMKTRAAHRAVMRSTS